MESPCAHNRDMRRLVWGALLALVACGRSVAPAAAPPTPAPTPAIPAVSAIWRVESAARDSRDVRLSFVMAACAVIQRVVVKEAADRVVITLDEGGRGGKDCTEPLTRHRHVRLAAPLGDRALYDGGVVPAALVQP